MPTSSAYWFVFQSDQLLLNHRAEPLAAEAALIQPAQLLRQHHLGSSHGITYYCAELAPNAALPDHIVKVPLRKAFESMEKDWYKPLVKAYSIINWDKNHQFCGRCGASTSHQTGTFERHCKICGLILYPRISPSIIVLIRKENTLLMARSPHFKPGVYGLIAGFVEVGESIEDAVHREVHEEVGLQIKNLRYFGSQPWPFPDSLMIGFVADYASGDMVIDHHEIEDAGWYRFDALPQGPISTISIARQLIDAFIAEQKVLSLK